MPLPEHSDMPGPVAAAFGPMPEPTRRQALRLRSVIFAVAARQGLAPPLEALRWGEPAYLPGRDGTAVRIGWDRNSGACKLLVHCRTSLVERWRLRHGDSFQYDGNRAVILPQGRELDEDALGHCIADAFGHHRSPARRSSMYRA